MSCRYWCAIAFGLTLLAPLALAQETQQPATRSQPSTSGNQGEATATGDGNAAPEPGYAERFLTAIERIEPAIRELIAEESETAAQEQRERDNADLRAQESMAVWAFWMFIASALSVGLTGVGVVLIWRTLLHTRDAAIHAGAAVEEAKKATKAAQDAVDVTRDLGRAQVRSYMGITSCELKRKKGDSFLLRMMVRNSGQSPARNVMITASGHLRLRRKDGEGTKHHDAPLATPNGTVLCRSHLMFIGSGGETLVEMEFLSVGFSSNGYGDKSTTQTNVSVHLNINSTDVFGGIWSEDERLSGVINTGMREYTAIDAYPSHSIADTKDVFPVYRPKNG